MKNKPKPSQFETEADYNDAMDAYEREVESQWESDRDNALYGSKEMTIEDLEEFDKTITENEQKNRDKHENI